MGDGRDFVCLVSKFKLRFCLSFLVERNLFIFPSLVHLHTLMKHLLWVRQS